MRFGSAAKAPSAIRLWDGNLTNAPFGETLRILLLMAQRPGYRIHRCQSPPIHHKGTQWEELTVLPARVHPCTAIHSKPQAHLMQRIAHSLHPVREFRAVGHQRATGVAPGGPAVVEDNVVIAEVAEAVVNDLLGGGKEEVLADVAAEGVPVILAGRVSSG